MLHYNGTPLIPLTSCSVIVLYALWKLFASLSSAKAAKLAVDPEIIYEQQQREFLTAITGLAFLQCWSLARIIDLEGDEGYWVKRLWKDVKQLENREEKQDEAEQKEECGDESAEVTTTTLPGAAKIKHTEELDALQDMETQPPVVEETPPKQAMPDPEDTREESHQPDQQDPSAGPKPEDIPLPISQTSTRRGSQSVIRPTPPSFAGIPKDIQPAERPSSIDFSATPWDCLQCKAANFPQYKFCCNCAAKKPQKKRQHAEITTTPITTEIQLTEEMGSSQDTEVQRITVSEGTPQKPQTPVSGNIHKELQKESQEELNCNPRPENIPPPIPPKSKRREKQKDAQPPHPAPPPVASDKDKSTSIQPTTRLPSIDFSAKPWDCLQCKATNIAQERFCCNCGIEKPQKKRRNVRLTTSVDVQATDSANTKDFGKKHQGDADEKKLDEPTDPSLKPWDCPKCKTKNSRAYVLCSHCTINRPKNEAAVTTPLQPEAIVSLPPIQSTPRSKSIQKVVISHPQPPAFEFLAQPWECSRCMASNFAEYIYCCQCGQDKDEKTKKELDKKHQAGLLVVHQHTARELSDAETEVIGNTEDHTYEELVLPPATGQFPSEETQADGFSSFSGSGINFTGMGIWSCLECGECSLPEDIKCGNCGIQKPGKKRKSRKPDAHQPTDNNAPIDTVGNDGGIFWQAQGAEEALCITSLPTHGSLPEAPDDFHVLKCLQCGAFNRINLSQCAICLVDQPEAGYVLQSHGEPVAPPGPKQNSTETWTCTVCKYTNLVFDFNCESCGQKRHSTPPDPFVGFSEAFVWACPRCGVINNTHDSFCNTCATPRPEKWVAAQAAQSGSDSDDIPMNRARPLPNPFHGQEMAHPAPKLGSNSDSDDIPMRRARPLIRFQPPPAGPRPLCPSWPFSLDRIPSTTNSWTCSSCATENLSILPHCAHCGYPNESFSPESPTDFDSSCDDDVTLVGDTTLAFQDPDFQVLRDMGNIEPFNLDNIDLNDVNPWWCDGCVNWNIAPVGNCPTCGEQSMRIEGRVVRATTRLSIS